MITNKRKKRVVAEKSRHLSLISIVLFGILILQGFIFTASTGFKHAESRNSLEVNTQIAMQQTLAKSISISDELESLSSDSDEPITIYNFVVPIRFKNETLQLNHTWNYGKSYYDIFDEMYNTSAYSVNEYYKIASNGQVDLQTVIIGQTTPVEISKVRGYFSTTATDPDNGYVGDMNRVMREKEILDQVFGEVVDFVDGSEYMDKVDYNNDKKIDSVSIITLPEEGLGNTYNPRWGDLLWPHQFAYPDEFSFLLRGFQNSKGDTIKPSKFMLDYMKASDSVFADLLIPNNSTAIHELGHLVFDLPDLYNYDPALDAQDAPVDYWDLMAGSGSYRATNLLTYMREKIDLKVGGTTSRSFISPSQVKEILKSDTYTLQATTYEDIKNEEFSLDRTLAYKIVNPNIPTQAIYMEYRVHDENSFDNDANIKDGLLVYRIDEGFKASSDFSHFSFPGNFYGPPYNVYVFRADNLTDNDKSIAMQSAPINDKQTSMGEQIEYQMNYESGQYDFRSPKITWQNYSTSQGDKQDEITNVTYEDSGIVIKFVRQNPEDMSITFSVEWDGFVEEKKYVLPSQVNNPTLYSALLNLANKGSDQTLEKNEFIDFLYMNLSSLNLSSISGLELFELNPNVVIDLANNNLSSLGGFSNTFLDINNDISINLVLNEFYNANLVNSLKSTGKQIVFGLQKIQKQLYVLPSENNLGQVEDNLNFYFYNDYSSYYNLSGNLPSNVIDGLNEFETVGDFVFEFTPKSTLLSGSFTSQIKVVSLEVKEQGERQLEVFSNFNVEDYLVKSSNLEWASIQYIFQDEGENTIQAGDITQTIGQKSIFFVSNALNIKYELSLNIVDTQAPEITLTSSEKVFVLKGEELESPQVQVTDNYDENLTWQTNSQINLDNVGEYDLEVFAQDSSGNVSESVNITIVVIDIQIQTGIEVEVFGNLNYLDYHSFYPEQYKSEFNASLLAGVDLTRLGLKQFKLQFQNTSISQARFEIVGNVLVVDSQPPTITLASSEKVFVLKGDELELPQVQVTDNYDENITWQTNSFINTNITGEKQVEVFAQDSSGNLSEKVNIMVVIFEVTTRLENKINVNSEIDYSSFYTITPQQYQDEFDFEVVEQINNTLIGSYNLKLILTHSNQINLQINLELQVIVGDFQAPVLELVNQGKRTIYLYVGSNYIPPIFTATDNYTPNDVVLSTLSSNSAVNTQRIGTYYIEYYVKDSSGNISNRQTITVKVLPEPIENLAVIKVSNIKIITPNTLLSFKVDTSNIDVTSRTEPIKYVWFVNGVKVYEGTKEFLEYKFNKIGEYKVEVKAENLHSTGEKRLSEKSQVFIVNVTEGGVLDKYTLIIVGLISAVVVLIIIVTQIINKARKRSFMM